MVEPIRVDANVWECPVCGFRAMSRKVVENHMRNEHKIEPKAESKANSGVRKMNNNSGGFRKNHKNQRPKDKKKKKDRREIMNELHHDYVFELLHNKKAVVYVRWGGEVKEFRGMIHARDPYSILIDTDEGRWIISKGQIIAYKFIETT